MKLELTFRLEKETKNTVRYQEVGADEGVLARDDGTAVVGTLYLSKMALGQSRPPVLTLTITDE